MRRIILEGLEEGGRVLSPRYKAKVFTLKKKSLGEKKKLSVTFYKSSST